MVSTESNNKTQGSNPTTSRFCRFFYSCKRPFSWSLSIFAHDMGNERSVLRFSSRVGAHLVFSKFALEENVIPHQWQVCGIFRHKNSLCNDDFSPVATAHGTVGRFQIFLCLDSNRFKPFPLEELALHINGTGWDAWSMDRIIIPVSGSRAVISKSFQRVIMKILTSQDSGFYR